jgi:hypothetical protein
MSDGRNLANAEIIRRVGPPSIVELGAEGETRCVHQANRTIEP